MNSLPRIEVAGDKEIGGATFDINKLYWEFIGYMIYIYIYIHNLYIYILLFRLTNNNQESDMWLCLGVFEIGVHRMVHAILWPVYDKLLDFGRLYVHKFISN